MGKALWSTTSACASVPGSRRVRPLTPDFASKFGTPCLNNTMRQRSVRGSVRSIVRSTTSEVEKKPRQSVHTPSRLSRFNPDAEVARPQWDVQVRPREGGLVLVADALSGGRAPGMRSPLVTETRAAPSSRWAPWLPSWACNGSRSRLRLRCWVEASAPCCHRWWTRWPHRGWPFVVR